MHDRHAPSVSGRSSGPAPRAHQSESCQRSAGNELYTCNRRLDRTACHAPHTHMFRHGHRALYVRCRRLGVPAIERVRTNRSAF